jgi:AAA domain/Primase C terminal 2 (PriCT-2)
MNGAPPLRADRTFALDRDRIPAALKKLPRWVLWRAGPPKANGKFDKVPVNAKHGHPVNANNSANWLSFADACAAYDSGACSGVGIALSSEPVAGVGDTPLYLVAVDLDGASERITALKEVWIQLGQPYREISPSGNGLRMFALSHVPIDGGNDGKGNELYGQGRFMTVTGDCGKGDVSDATDALIKLQALWFPAKARKSLNTPNALTLSLVHPAREETPSNLATVKAQLACVSADCSYERWRDLVWAVLSTGWTAAEDIARQWSQSASARFESKAFEQVVNSFDPSRGISLGTLVHYAREGGWKPAQSEAVVAESSTETRADASAPTRLLTREDLRALPSMQWRVRDLLPACGLAAIYGPSGSGKTFVALDLACTIAAGLPKWFGATVKPGPVAYIGLEGRAGLPARVNAWEIEKMSDLPPNLKLRFLLDDFSLLREGDVDCLAADITAQLGTGVVVIVDTLNQAAPGADENASADMGNVIANSKALADQVDGVVLLVHHAGKDASRGMRGHSSLFAAMDTVIEVSTSPSGRSWRLSKSKEGESGVAHGFDLAPHIVGRNREGEQITSCAVRPAVLHDRRTANAVTGKNQKVALKVLTGLLRDHPNGLPIEAATRAVGEVMTCEMTRRGSRAAEAIKSLTASGHLVEIDGGITLS